ncbi:MAG: hypothetical protein J6Y24_06180 [Bacteroidales bacterium]|nr:hypothetical protein [Bacteroidales bacterium]
MASVPEIVLNNPFRVLGVYANSSYREIVATISKATKFMEVGKKVDYPLDLPRVKNLKVKSNFSHSLEDLDNALAMISNSEERLKYAQFWFLRITPLDDEAFDVLFSGKPNHALSVWNREDNLSSLQNRVIIYLWKCDFKLALQNAEKLYNKYSDEFLKAVDSKGTLVKSANDLIQTFVETLVEYITPNKLLEYIPSPVWLDCIIPTISDDTLAKINSAIKDTQDLLDILNSEGVKSLPTTVKSGIGDKLIIDTKNEYHLLLKVVSPDDPRLQLVSDRLANMLYECSIDEYNLRKFSPKYSIDLLQNALTLANNSMDKEEINSKIALFQKKAEKTKWDNPSDDGELSDGCILIMVMIVILGILFYASLLGGWSGSH